MAVIGLNKIYSVIGICHGSNKRIVFTEEKLTQIDT